LDEVWRVLDKRPYAWLPPPYTVSVFVFGYRFALALDRGIHLRLGGEVILKIVDLKFFQHIRPGLGFHGFGHGFHAESFG
jgi:hypothetical protein